MHQFTISWFFILSLLKWTKGINFVPQQVKLSVNKRWLTRLRNMVTASKMNYHQYLKNPWAFTCDVHGQLAARRHYHWVWRMSVSPQRQLEREVLRTARHRAFVLFEFYLVVLFFVLAELLLLCSFWNKTRYLRSKQQEKMTAAEIWSLMFQWPEPKWQAPLSWCVSSWSAPIRKSTNKSFFPNSLHWRREYEPMRTSSLPQVHKQTDR